MSGFEDASTETLTVIAANLRQGLDVVAERIAAGTFHTVGPKGSAPPSQAGHLTLALLEQVEAELAARSDVARKGDSMALPPVWLLDVDGVINAATKKPDRSVWPAEAWVHGRAHDGRHEWPILFARPVADFIRQVHEQERAEIRWHTTWQEAGAAIGKLLDLPDFPVQESPEWPLRDETEEWWKLGAALRVVEEEKRALVWTDDDATEFSLKPDMRARITTAQPSLIIAPRDHLGLTRKHLRQIDTILTEQAA